MKVQSNWLDLLKNKKFLSIKFDSKNETTVQVKDKTTDKVTSVRIPNTVARLMQWWEQHGYYP